VVFAKRDESVDRAKVIVIGDEQSRVRSVACS
jgi:hypothetical protein